MWPEPAWSLGPDPTASASGLPGPPAGPGKSDMEGPTPVSGLQTTEDTNTLL